MEKLSANHKFKLSVMLSLDNILFDNVDISEALDVIEKYSFNLYSKKIDITPLIGKTDSPILLNYAINANDIELVKKCLYCKYKRNIFFNALHIGNPEIIIAILKLMKPEDAFEWFHYPSI
jgi:hypothetical protein